MSVPSVCVWLLGGCGPTLSGLAPHRKTRSKRGEGGGEASRATWSASNLPLLVGGSVQEHARMHMHGRDPRGSGREERAESRERRAERGGQKEKEMAGRETASPRRRDCQDDEHPGSPPRWLKRQAALCQIWQLLLNDWLSVVSPLESISQAADSTTRCTIQRTSLLSCDGPSGFFNTPVLPSSYCTLDFTRRHSPFLPWFRGRSSISVVKSVTHSTLPLCPPSSILQVVMEVLYCTVLPGYLSCDGTLDYRVPREVLVHVSPSFQLDDGSNPRANR